MTALAIGSDDQSQRLGNFGADARGTRSRSNGILASFNETRFGPVPSWLLALPAASRIFYRHIRQIRLAAADFFSVGATHASGDAAMAARRGWRADAYQGTGLENPRAPGRPLASSGSRPSAPRSAWSDACAVRYLRGPCLVCFSDFHPRATSATNTVAGFAVSLFAMGCAARRPSLLVILGGSASERLDRGVDRRGRHLTSLLPGLVGL